jgi:hypothetical protein
MAEHLEDLLESFRKFRHQYHRFMVSGSASTGRNSILALNEALNNIYIVRKEITTELKTGRDKHDIRKLDRLLNLEELENGSTTE